MYKGQEFLSIIQNIFTDIRGIGPQFQTNCPRCGEEQNLPEGDGKFNLEISTSKKVFKCWRCSDPSFSGSLGKLIKIYGSQSDYDLYKSYAGVYSDYSYEDEDNYVQVKLPDEMILFSQMEANNLEHFEAYNYLINVRKISREIILKYRLGFCLKGKYERRIIIPSYDIQGEITYFVGRSYNSKEKRKYLNPIADKDKIIFNEGFINFDSTVFLVEGVTDMFSVPNAIPMLGKTISTLLYLKLKEMKPDVIILLDPDAYKNSIELYYRLYTIYVECEEKVKLVKLPTMEDLDELRRNQGVEKVIECLYTARDLTTEDYFISKLQKPYDKRNGRYDSNSKYFEWKQSSTRNAIR